MGRKVLFFSVLFLYLYVIYIRVIQENKITNLEKLIVERTTIAVKNIDPQTASTTPIIYMSVPEAIAKIDAGVGLHHQMICAVAPELPPCQR